MSAPTRSSESALSAWLVHAMTASGAVIAILALFAIDNGDFGLALVWLLIGLAVDGIDGTLARRLEVRRRVPRIDGETLDLVVDYLTYVFVPTLFIWKAGLVPAAAALPLAAAIQLSAIYVFARRDMKSEDNYFRGFPALWNLVAFYLWVARPDPDVAAIAVAVFVGLSFEPIHFVHPFRVTDYGRWLPALATLWGLATLALLWPGWGAPARAGLLGLSLALGAILIAMGLLRTARGPRVLI